MAQVILSSVGQALGGPIGGAIGSTIGAAIDTAALQALTPPSQRGPRLTGLPVTGAAEGAPLPQVFGRARIGGQVIWAARFREALTTSGGKSGPRVTRASYSLSFAVALCEGPIDGVGRIWADGRPFEAGAATVRVHLGGEDQAPDPLIEAIEGAAPAYRGVAYVVFEDLPLEPFGNRPPQLSFEVFRRPAGAAPELEDRLEGVCLIPGAGEFVYDTRTILRRESLVRTRAENRHAADGRADLLVSLDRLKSDLPAVKRVTLVVTWFGDDLRAGVCRVRPGVERRDKPTLPLSWEVSGRTREDAWLVSAEEGRPNYGGTPSDASVIAAIRELKARGYEVALLPFLMMDVPAGSGRPDPWSGGEQPAFPWRGRLTCHPAPGRSGSPDRTTTAGQQVRAFFGAAEPEHVVVDGERVSWAGPDDFGWRRQVLHYARLAVVAGGVDAFLIGTEFAALTKVREAPGVYPAVVELKRLAADARAILGPETRLSYAADWTEWNGHQPADGTGEVRFHLDPLWADPNVDFVGIDWYPPLTDWRAGDGGLDAEETASIYDPGFLRSRVAGGEAFDWYYASDADRDAQARTPITDGAHGEPWVFRPKDLIGWWSNPHHDRPGGVRSPTPTAWVPKSKPIRFVEFGCPAVDRGANAPNLFPDPKSAEGALPPFSTGARDDRMQRAALAAVLDRFAEPDANPTSPLYGGPMLEAADVWCWDARPYPEFPARADVWTDAANWATGHWLNGRAGGAEANALFRALAARSGLPPSALETSEASGAIEGYVVDRPMAATDAIAPLLEVFGVDLVETPTGLALRARSGPPDLTLTPEAHAFDPDGAPVVKRRLDPAPRSVRVRYLDGGGEYAVGAEVERADGPQDGGDLNLDLPVVMDAGQARALARRALEDAAARETRLLRLSLLDGARLEVGDRVAVDGRTWRVAAVERDERPRAELVPTASSGAPRAGDGPRRPPDPEAPVGPPLLRVIDAPPVPFAETDRRPIAVAAGDPWRAVDLHAGPTAEALTLRGRADRSASVGVLLDPLPPAASRRIDRGASVRVRMETGELEARSHDAVLAGFGLLAVETAAGFEFLRPLGVTFEADRTWRLTELIRADLGSDAAAELGAEAGALVVRIEPDLPRLTIADDERDASLILRAAPAGGPAGGQGASELSFVWTDRHALPFRPAHARLESLAGGGLRLRWTRRGRVLAPFDAEPALDGAELYRVRVTAGGAVVREATVEAPVWTYEAGDQANDFGGPAPRPLRVEIAQAAADGRFGPPLVRDM